MSTTEINLQKLQLIQNCACRIILEADILTPTNTMHDELGLLTLKDRRNLHLAMECHNNIYNKEARLHDMFIKLDQERERTTRSTNTNCMKVKNVRTLTGHKAYSYRGPAFWNTLEEDIRQIEDKNSFKKHITKLMCRDVNHPG